MDLDATDANRIATRPNDPIRIGPYLIATRPNLVGLGPVTTTRID
jgi:hypothetical protein